MDFPIISNNPRIQAHYIACRKEGTSHNLAEMFALAAPPMSNTDREFLQGHCNGNQFIGQEQIGDFYRKEAEAAGVNPTGKVYMAGLANYPGDPEAWVSGRGDVQRVCEQRGFDCEGSVNVKAARCRDTAPKEIGIADDIVDREVGEIMAAVEDPTVVDPREVRESVVAKRKPYWAK